VYILSDGGKYRDHADVVIAHAAFGHNHFFKNNYLSNNGTDAEGILDYLDFAKTTWRNARSVMAGWRSNRRSMRRTP